MRGWLLHTARGLCMGISDAIPGVSGGTIALILGIYPRLIESIGGLGVGSIKRLSQRAFWDRLRHGLKDPEALGSDAQDRDADRVLFLAFLGVGVVVAILLGSRVIPDLLDRYPAHMKGLFMGLVLASVSIPVRMIKRPTWKHGVFGILVAVVTVWFVGLPTEGAGKATGVVLVRLPVGAASTLITPENTVIAAPRGDGGPAIRFGPAETHRLEAGEELTVFVVARMAGEAGNLSPNSFQEVSGPEDGMTVRQDEAMSGGVNPSLGLLFIAGMVAISAMILPGISGSFVLLLFGLYHYVTFSLRMAVFNQDADAMIVVLTVVAAIGIGLLTFSRVMRWLFSKAPDPTLAALVGLMLGSLPKLWPFVEFSPGMAEKLVLPGAMTSTVVGVLGAFAVGVVLVLILEAVGRQSNSAMEV